MMPSRTDRLYLGWQYATPHPDPGPPPRRPTPPEHERLDPAWAAAQRREESLLNRPLKSAFLVATVIGALAVAAGAAGWLPILAAGLAVIGCVLVAAVCGYGVWQGERALRSRMADERSRVGKIRAAQESELSAWQAGHATRVREWQAPPRRLRAAETVVRRQRARRHHPGRRGWRHPVRLVRDARHGRRAPAGGRCRGHRARPDRGFGRPGPDRLRPGFRHRSRSSGCCPTTCLGSASVPDWTAGGLADVLSLVASAAEEQSSTRDLAFDNAILERVIGVLGGTATVAAWPRRCGRWPRPATRAMT